MASLSVRVIPRSRRRGVEVTRSVIVVKVYSPPVEGKATEEARKLLAEVLGVPRASVTIRSGARSRLKVFDVDGITDAQLDEKLRRR